MDFFIYSLYIPAAILGGWKLTSWQLIVQLFGLLPNLNWFAWYVFFYIFCMLVMPLLCRYRVFRFKPLVNLVLMLVVPYIFEVGLHTIPNYEANTIIHDLNSCFLYFPCFLVGYWMAENKILEKARHIKWMDNPMISIFGIAFVFDARICINSVAGFLLDVFYVPIFIYFSVNLLETIEFKPVLKILSLFGKYSTGMWFFHAVFFSTYVCNIFKPILLFVKPPAFMFIWIVFLSFIGAYVYQKILEGFDFMFKHIKIGVNMVSIIVPIYNAEKFLKRCLKSIINQTYQNIEIVLVNDGSKDHSLEIIEEFRDRDSRIRIFNQNNKGVAAARNTGLENSSGKYILYVDSDDWLEPDAVERLLNKMNDDVDIVFCSSDHAKSPEFVEHEKQAEYEIWDHDRQIMEFILHKHMSGMLWNKMMRRSLTEGIAFNERTGYGEDAEFLWKVLQRTQKMVVTNEILYHHVLEETSISHLAFTEKKYSSIPMWERINKDVERDYPQLIQYARISLMCAAVYGMYEARQCGYQNKEHIRHMRKIIRKNIGVFLKAEHISTKYKMYALAVCVGY